MNYEDKYLKVNKFVLKHNLPVRMMYKRKPSNKLDTGWRLISGDELEFELQESNMVVISLRRALELEPRILDKLSSNNNVVQFSTDVLPRTIDYVFKIINKR